MAFKLIYVAAAIIGGLIETSPTPPSVVLDGQRDAVFLYNASGQLISSIAPTAGTDSFGNSYSAIFNAGVQNGAHFGVDSHGICYFVNAADQSVIMINPTKEAFFAYSGAPAAGNLTTSIAATAGTNDSFGNQYPEGVTSYNNTQVTYANLDGAVLKFGPIVAGVPDLTDASFIYGSAVGELALNSGTQAAPTNDPAEIILIAGQQNQKTGSLAAPQIFIGDLKLNSDVDVYQSGSLIKTDATGNPYTWQTPTFNSGYSASVLAQYRLDGLDNVVWDISVSQTTGSGAAGAASIIAAVPSQYRPKTHNRPVPCAWTSSAQVAKGAGIFRFNTDGTVSLMWPAATANGDIFSATVSIPLGNVA